MPLVVTSEDLTCAPREDVVCDMPAACPSAPLKWQQGLHERRETWDSVQVGMQTGTEGACSRRMRGSVQVMEWNNELARTAQRAARRLAGAAAAALNEMR